MGLGRLHDGAADVFRKLGGFDGDFFAHMEEIDFCWRAQLAGYRIMVEPRSRVFHLGGGTLPNNSPRKLYLNYRNNLSMLYKNLSKRTLWPLLFTRMVLDGMSAFVFLMQGRRDFFKVVFRSHMDFYKILGMLRAKRRAIQRDRTGSAAGNIYRGSIILRHALGRRTFGPDDVIIASAPGYRCGGFSVFCCGSVSGIAPGTGL